MYKYSEILKILEKEPKTWLITGVAGFIGSNLLESLLLLDQNLVGIDNFSTGHIKNLDEVRLAVGEERWKKFKFVEGDISDFKDCQIACKSVEYVLHQGALGSVPRSIKDPINTNNSNVTGFLNILTAAKEANVKSFTYAASSSTYGDHPDLPKREENIGNPLSPYAVTKYVNELYASVFSRSYGFNSIGLRYFNVFGKRQDPEGAYAAVIPKWIKSMVEDKDLFINGDGKTSRDFCYVQNVIQANILAAVVGDNSKNHVYNVAVGGRTSLNELFNILRSSLLELGLNYKREPLYRDFREGDVLHSQADISKARKSLGYIPEYNVKQGIKAAMPWYISNLLKES